jgi:hypothetical protein
MYGAKLPLKFFRYPTAVLLVTRLINGAINTVRKFRLFMKAADCLL